MSRKVMAIAILVACLVAIGACVSQAFAQGAQQAASLSSGLPWIAVGIIGTAALQTISIGLNIFGHGAKRVQIVEATFRSELKASEKRASLEASETVKGIKELHAHLDRYTQAVVGAINEERIHSYTREVECAQRHDEELPCEPKMLKIPGRHPPDSGF